LNLIDTNYIDGKITFQDSDDGANVYSVGAVQSFRDDPHDIYDVGAIEAFRDQHDHNQYVEYGDLAPRMSKLKE
jgi:hypothetical protein